MTCLSVQPMLEALLDGELDPNQNARILEHLETCPSCSSKYEGLKKLSADIRAQATYFRAPDSLRQKVISSLHSVGDLSSQPLRLRTMVAWKWLAAAACVVMAVSRFWGKRFSIKLDLGPLLSRRRDSL